MVRNAPPAPERRGNPSLWVFLLAIVVILVATVGSDPAAWRQRLAPPTAPVEPALQPSNLVVRVDPDSIRIQETDFETAALMNIYAKGNPSVVQIRLLSLNTGLGSRALGEGSGFVWDTEGHIVTNAHVVDARGLLQVIFPDDTVSLGRVKAADPYSDLAVVKIDPQGYDLQPVVLGNIDELQVGMRVAAIGSPFSQAQTLTSGIVSALGRNIYALNPNYQIPDSIQFDAAINPGNSGGPLFNDAGEVVGVVAQIISPDRVSSGIGMAVPVSIVKRVIPTLIAEGSYQHSFLGIRGSTYSPICASQLGLPPEARGVYVAAINSNSPAWRGNLRGGNSQLRNPRFPQICPTVVGGDLIVGIEGQEVTSFSDLMIYLERYTSPGDQVSLTVLRDENYVNLDVVLGARP